MRSIRQMSLLLCFTSHYLVQQNCQKPYRRLWVLQLLGHRRKELTQSFLLGECLFSGKMFHRVYCWAVWLVHFFSWFSSTVWMKVRISRWTGETFMFWLKKEGGLGSFNFIEIGYLLCRAHLPSTFKFFSLSKWM